MNTLYADITSLATAIEIVSEETTLEGEDARVDVYNCEPKMRGIPLEEVRERNLIGHIGESVCTLGYDGTRWTLKFHQSKLDRTFKLIPAPLDEVDAQQAHPPDILSNALTPVVEKIEEEYDVISWDFTEVSAASMASAGHFTDFEFEYVISGL